MLHTAEFTTKCTSSIFTSQAEKESPARHKEKDIEDKVQR